MSNILNEIEDGLKELIKETDDKYDKFLFEDERPRILQVIDAFEKARQEADQAAFDAPSADSGAWRGTFANAMQPNADAQYQEYMKNQPAIEDRNAKAKGLQDKAQELADEIKKEYAWIVKATRGKGLKRYASLSDMIDYFKQKYSQEQPLNEKVYKVYHGTNQEFDKFDFKRATQGIVWFTDSPESIQKGEHGGAGNKIIMTRYITINNPAGWAEYEKYGLQQLEDMGYDGVILPQGDKTDYFVFSNKSIKKTGPKELQELYTADPNDNTWAIFKITGGKKSFVTSIENDDFIHVTDYAVKYSDPSVPKFSLDKAKEIISKNMYYDEKFGVVNSKGIQKIFVKKGSSYSNKLRFDSSNELNEDSMADVQRRYKEARAELEPLDAKQLKAKVKQYEAEYEEAKKRYDYNSADVAYSKYYVAKELLDEKKHKKSEEVYQKLIGQPFMGSTITNIAMPYSYEGLEEILKIFLANEGEFRYEGGRFPEFTYFDANSNLFKQDLRNPHINPTDAILTNNDLRMLNSIVKLYNLTAYKKMPLPHNVITKDGTTSYEPPTAQKQDFQWLIGQGDPNNKRKQISDVSVSNNTEKSTYSGGFINLHIEVGDHPFINDYYTYSISFNQFFKPLKEELTVRHGISRDNHEVKGLDNNLYEPFVKAIQQINPQSKLVNKLSRYRF